MEGKDIGKYQRNGVVSQPKSHALTVQMFTDLMDKKTPPQTSMGYVDMFGVQISLNLRKITIIPKVLNLNDQGIWRKTIRQNRFTTRIILGEIPNRRFAWSLDEICPSSCIVSKLPSKIPEKLPDNLHQI